MFKLFGTVVSHCIVQCGIGISCLAPACFSYLVTDNEEELMTELTLADMPESDTKAMLVEVS
jgi:hypothetical protein